MRQGATVLSVTTTAVLTIVVCLLNPATLAAQAKAVVPEPSVDLGEIPKGDAVFHDFVVRNDGDRPLLIESARSSCGCTVADFDQSIAPAERGTVRVKLDSRTLTGPVDSEIRLQTSDPENPAITLKIAALVRPFLGALPGYARWNTVETETVGTIGITLWPLDKQPFEISEIEVTYPDITASVQPAKQDERYADYDGDQWRVELTLGSEPPIGTIAGYAEIRTTHPKQSLVHIPVSGFVRPLIFVTPDRSDLGSFTLGSEIRRARYEVRNFGTAPMTIERVEIDTPGVGTSVETVEEGFIYQVAAIFDPETVTAGEFSGEMVVHTDLEKRPTVSWPIKGTILPGSSGEPSNSETADGHSSR